MPHTKPPMLEQDPQPPESKVELAIVLALIGLAVVAALAALA